MSFNTAIAAPLYDAVVIGAGQAGLAAGYHLRQAGLRFVILDASDAAGGSWRHYYRSLRLFSPARFSSLPGMPFPGDPDAYPSRDATIDYLQRYAVEQGLPVLPGQRVTQVTRLDNGLFEVHAEGQTWRTRSVIAASGSFQRPRMPTLAGQDGFQGRQLHSLDYREPQAFAGQRVVVVGAANSGVQIATELARVARVSIAARRPPSLIRQRLLGLDVHFWWWLFGLDTAETNTRRAALFKRWHAKRGPAVLDAGAYGRALAAGQPDVRPMFRAFSREGVVWADGVEEAVDAVVFATGFQPNLDYLHTLGALDPQRLPRQRRGISSAVPGLYYLGLSYQRTYASATLRGVGPDAQFVVSHLAQYLVQQAPAELAPASSADLTCA
jgi:putative flavoprotein involved in K+ transport